MHAQIQTNPIFKFNIKPLFDRMEVVCNEPYKYNYLYGCPGQDYDVTMILAADGSLCFEKKNGCDWVKADPGYFLGTAR